jgi:hypothetical protein
MHHQADQSARELAGQRQLETDREAGTSVPDPESHVALSRPASMRRALARAEVVASADVVQVHTPVGPRAVTVLHVDDFSQGDAGGPT